MNIKKVIRFIWLFIILAAPIYLWILPSTFFDDTGIVTCPSIILFDIECFGCGMTRAIMHFHHFEYSEAIYYNYGVLLVYPFLIYMWFVWLKIGLKHFGLFPNLSNT